MASWDLEAENLSLRLNSYVVYRFPTALKLVTTTKHEHEKVTKRYYKCFNFHLDCKVIIRHVKKKKKKKMYRFTMGSYILIKNIKCSDYSDIGDDTDIKHICHDLISEGRDPKGPSVIIEIFHGAKF